MVTRNSSAVSLPAELWDLICAHLDTPGLGRHPRHGSEALNFGGQRDLQNLRLVNRSACRSASRLAFRSIGQTHSGHGVRALSELAISPYASSVRALSMDIDNDLALSRSFDSDLLPSATQIGSIVAQYPHLNSIWVMKYPLAQGPCNRADWSGVRSERAKTLAFTWIEAVKKLGGSELKQLNLVFSSVAQMKQFAAQLETIYPEGRSESWFQASMIEEASGPLKTRAAHDVRCIFSIMPTASINNRQLKIAGSMGRKEEYRSYRLMQYIPATPRLESLHLTGVDIDGESLERILLNDGQTLKSVEIYSSTLRTASWATIFSILTENCVRLEHLQAGCLGYLLPFSSIMEKMSDEEREQQIADDSGTLTFLLQTIAGRRWEKGMRQIAPALLCTACESQRRTTRPSEVYQAVIRTIDGFGSQKEPKMLGADPLTITNESWKNMLWLHGQLWEG